MRLPDADMACMVMRGGSWPWLDDPIINPPLDQHVAVFVAGEAEQSS